MAILIRTLYHDDSPEEKQFIHDQGQLIFRSEVDNTEYYLLQEDAISWLVDLNIHLARKKIWRIEKDQFHRLFRVICPNNIRAEFPASFIHLGHRLGLIGNDFEESFLFFPIARVLGLCRTHLELGIRVFTNLSQDGLEHHSGDEDIRRLIDQGFSKHKDEEIAAVKEREGLTCKRKQKLRQMAKQLGLSAEGVRRRELKFWDAIERNPDYYLQSFYRAFLALIVSRSGSLLQITDGEWDLEFLFLGKCLGLSMRTLPNIGLTILSKKNTTEHELLNKEKAIRVQFEDAISDTKQQFENQFSFEDIVAIGKRIQRNRQDRIKSTARVYLCLKQLGKPAHYSEVAKVHNQIFPQFKTSENNIHSYLSRQEYGVVWTGERGIFGLREFGSARPQMTISERIFEIVSRIHEETERPVSYNTVLVELARYRNNVKENTVRAGLSNNRKIKKVGRQGFVPRTEAEIEVESRRDTLLHSAVASFISGMNANDPMEYAPSEVGHLALFRCTKCGNHESKLIYENRLLLMQCTRCDEKIKYPSGMWGVHTTIPCPKCGNDFTIGFHQRYGPYLKCRKCGFWDRIEKHLTNSC